METSEDGSQWLKYSFDMKMENKKKSKQNMILKVRSKKESGETPTAEITLHKVSGGDEEDVDIQPELRG